MSQITGVGWGWVTFLKSGFAKSLQLHSGPHLGSGQVLDTETPPKERPRLPVNLLAFEAEVEGSCVRSYVGSPGDDGRGRVLRELRQLNIHPSLGPPRAVC